jgi:hypothetical protein
MSTLAAHAPVQTAPAAAGFYLRESLAGTGRIPVPGPYGLCPDIIGSAEPIRDAQSALRTPASWKTMYSVSPLPGRTSYYYVRGMNGTTESINGSLALYWAPANLVMFPSVWKGNEIPAAAKAAVRVSAGAKQVGVGDAPFVFSSPLVDPATYMAFVACASDTANPAPIPVISSWLDMGAMQTERRDISIRNTSTVTATDQSWCRRVALEVPSWLPAAKIILSVTATGFTGNTVGLLGDMFADDRQPILLVPDEVYQDGGGRAIPVSLASGQTLNLTVQYWHTGSQPSPGATITLAADYVPPAQELAEVAERALVHPLRSRFLAEAARIDPTVMVPLGSATFMVA